MTYNRLLMKKDSEAWTRAHERVTNDTWTVFQGLDQCSYYNIRIRGVTSDGTHGRMTEKSYRTAGCFTSSPLEQLLRPGDSGNGLYYPLSSSEMLQQQWEPSSGCQSIAATSTITTVSFTVLFIALLDSLWATAFAFWFEFYFIHELQHYDWHKRPPFKNSRRIEYVTKSNLALNIKSRQ